MAGGGRQWSGGVRSLGSGAILLEFVSLPCVLGPLSKLISVINWITQESDSEMSQACRSFILDSSWSSTGGRDETEAGWQMNKSGSHTVGHWS